jgi:thiamine biosynthesis lipoprotein
VENFVHRGTFILPLFLALCLILSACIKTETITVPLLDTAVTITSHGELPVSSIEAVLTEVSDMTELSFDNPHISETSDITKKTAALNERFGNEIDIHIGALTRLWGISTDNPRVPTGTEIAAAISDKTLLDLGAVAKGYALDRAYEAVLAADGDTEKGYAIVSAESSILLYGKKPNEKPFKTAIKSPFIPGEFVGYIETESAFISTSGGSERYFESDGKRYSHILDPSTGYPVETDFASVTVIVPTSTPDGGIMSDFLSTLIYIRGTEGLSEFEDNAFTFIAIDKNGDIYGNHDIKSI